MKLTRCCFCIQIKHAAIIIGTFNAISLFAAISMLEMIGIALRGFTVAWFLLIVLNKDTK